MNRAESVQDWLPDSIANYDILEVLGMGGMGIIYRAVQKPLNRVVALKVLPPQFCQDSESSQRFESEARAVSLLEHQNIVQIYEYGIQNDCRFIAMQFIDGENLSQRIASNKCLPIAEIIDYSKQICRGLRYAHSKEVIHRDIKPQNVLIDQNNVARLSDFGIAKIISQHDITMTGVTVGTPEFMSPEQAEGQDLTIHTDIYSLGIVIYEMLTRRPPFLGNNPIAIAYKQVHEIPTPPSLRRKDTPKRLELIVLKALKKKKEERYQSVEEMLMDLDSVDLDEKASRPTKKIAAYVKEGGTKRPLAEKRITDRRNFDRRYRGGGEDGLSIFSVAWWNDYWQSHWPTLVIILILYILFVVHLFRYHS